MKESARYVTIAEWPDEDGCYVGSCPGLLPGGCHGEDERDVSEALCVIVEETISITGTVSGVVAALSRAQAMTDAHSR